ncbi:MAG: trypsin-like serine protease [Bosea sp. (in: a-proteobacteria)]|uniref:S1 family peptidase n=1 Tax=Bosea sp. (in: a-proteobacteria) TaxID=1871050 RepID=UPI002734743B|nr:trypsin-like serine protease [Bosea sp. (in: a-proteobacteria)]MDP3257592.1 trypsin-like serine protease [Bosea sp. (in: a-proteobacteria)]MDP3318418.1 trypsin-like serine protease [Bosea sp. (in: a-proteobacteria)]
MRIGRLISLGSVVCGLALAVPPAGAVVGGRDGGPLGSSTLMVLNARGGVCTGIVLSPRTVLTAAHCAAGGTELRIHWKEGGEPVLLPPAAVAMHPDFRANAVATRQRSIDLALLRLAQPLPGRFRPADLRDGTPPRTGAPVVLAGYGVSREGEARSTGVYRSAALAVVEPYGPGKLLLWAADPVGAGKTAGPGACQGDSGGPMMGRDGDSVVAVTSWSTGPSGKSCGLLSQGVLVAPQRRWIDGTLAGWGERANWSPGS